MRTYTYPFSSVIVWNLDPGSFKLSGAPGVFPAVSFAKTALRLVPKSFGSINLTLNVSFTITVLVSEAIPSIGAPHIERKARSVGDAVTAARNWSSSAMVYVAPLLKNLEKLTFPLKTWNGVYTLYAHAALPNSII